MTISVLIFDKKNNLFGSAGFTHWPALGAINSFIESGSGLVVTQANLNYAYGRNGLKAMKTLSPESAYRKISNGDEKKESRQVALINSKGEKFSFTGSECMNFASHLIGEDYIIQGNILSNEDVLKAADEAIKIGNSIEERMMNALKNALKAGGEVRGIQSAYIKINKINTEEDPYKELYLDLRVDESKEPLVELQRIIDIQVIYKKFEKASDLFEEGQVAKSLMVFNEVLSSDFCTDEIRFWYGIMFSDTKEETMFDPKELLKKLLKEKSWKELYSRMGLK
tara:strand:- start:132315 stop:133160 length:846 start_codon:yes stop_codon:yes gene_type:complete